MERAIIFGVQNETLALLPLITRATFRHAWQALYRNLTLVDVKDVPFSLDRVVYETLTAVNDAALRLAKVHTIAHCRWDGKEDTRPKLHRAAALFLTVDFVSARPGVKLSRSQTSLPSCGLPGAGLTLPRSDRPPRGSPIFDK